MIPLVAACTDAENHLTNNRKNIRIGYGANIEAYTTYAQANLIEMDKDMYYSYLLNGRDFILTVLPKDPDEDTPYNKNLMFQAIYNGVTPYSEQIVNGNFSFTNPQYKILIYYITADKFLKWDEDATNKVDGSNNFISKALDLMGPASNVISLELKMVVWLIIAVNMVVTGKEFLLSVAVLKIKEMLF